VTPAGSATAKQAEDEDTSRVLRSCERCPARSPTSTSAPRKVQTGKVEKFRLQTEPKFRSARLETEALTAMTGEIWIDAAQGRVEKLEGRLQQDVDFGGASWEG